jgi:hypothetical protein
LQSRLAEPPCTIAGGFSISGDPNLLFAKPNRLKSYLLLRVRQECRSCHVEQSGDMRKLISTPTPPVAGQLLTDTEAAAILAVEPRTLRLWRATRSLPHIRITSKVIRYRRSDLESWLERRRTVIA